MKVLLTGAGGQLGQALRKALPAQIDHQPVELIATARLAEPSQGVLALDLADAAACKEMVRTHQPDWVLNAGAYTAVDRAEDESELAHSVNAKAPEAFASALAEVGGRLLQVSTDFVFSGTQGAPYKTDQPTAPLGVYGASKAKGEQLIASCLGLASDGPATILRTSWVYGPVGRNFFLTMLRLHAQRASSQEPLRVVADQVGCPTSTHGLASACWAALEKKSGGVLHWSDAGAASWYDFAVAIGELAVEVGRLDCSAQVEPITTEDYPTPAQRPAYSLLDCSDTRRRLGLNAMHWRAALQQVMRDAEQ